MITLLLTVLVIIAVIILIIGAPIIGIIILLPTIDLLTFWIIKQIQEWIKKRKEEKKEDS